MGKPVLLPYQSEAMTLRPIGAADLPDTLAWRNRDEARVWFKSSARLTMEQHQAWFQAYLLRDDDQHFIVEAEGRRVGQASVYRIDTEKSTAEIGRFLVSPDHAGHGHIDRACGALIALCKERLGLSYLYLEVYEANERAMRLYAHHGFSPESTNDGLVRMGLHLGR